MKNGTWINRMDRIWKGSMRLDFLFRLLILSILPIPVNKGQVRAVYHQG